MIELIVVLIISLLLIVFHTYLLSYLVDIDMNISEHLPYDYVHFNTFIQTFAKYKYNPNLKYDNGSIFLKQDGKNVVSLYASIVRFNDKCMIFYPISWIKYLLWMKNNFKKRYRVKKLWVEEDK